MILHKTKCFDCAIFAFNDDVPTSNSKLCMMYYNNLYIIVSIQRHT